MTNSLIGQRAGQKSIPIVGLCPHGEDAKAWALAARQADVSEDWLRTWAGACDFKGKAGEQMLVAGKKGHLAAVLWGLGCEDTKENKDRFLAGKLSRTLPAGRYRLANADAFPAHTALAWALDAYRFRQYKSSSPRWEPAQLCCPSPKVKKLRPVIDAVTLVRDLINTPAIDCGPQELEQAARDLALAHKARIRVTKGKSLERQFPLVHAVGMASTRPPRLIDMTWGPKQAPKVTLVGKGVCFDSGGLNIKPGNSMRTMKKDMGGAAHVLGLAALVMQGGLKIRLRVIIPAVENSIAGNAYRPGDILRARNGLHVEIGNTDAEGRLILADALSLADTQAPDLLIDMATLTGAARVALGFEVAPFYCTCDQLAEAMMMAADEEADPVWRLPLWPGYRSMLDTGIADINHISNTPYGGSITAALFLHRFVEKAHTWMHFDISAYNLRYRPGRPKGGEAQAVRALYAMLQERYAQG